MDLGIQLPLWLEKCYLRHRIFYNFTAIYCMYAGTCKLGFQRGKTISIYFMILVFLVEECFHAVIALKCFAQDVFDESMNGICIVILNYEIYVCLCV